jgi:hypothetical protein
VHVSKGNHVSVSATFSLLLQRFSSSFFESPSGRLIPRLVRSSSFLAFNACLSDTGIVSDQGYLAQPSSKCHQTSLEAARLGNVTFIARR